MQDVQTALYFDKKVTLLHALMSIISYGRSAPIEKITLLVKDYNSHTFNGPNDLWINSNGCIYFTDPYFPAGIIEKDKTRRGLERRKIVFYER